MTLQDIHNQALQLSIGERWRLVKSLLRSIQQEMLVLSLPISDTSSLAGLNPWTQSLVGAIKLDVQNSADSYVD
ncbi:MAG: hypothetical protein AAF728_16685, partial [Cyanobacteria bacterium P01_D01_bin.128]